MGYDGIVFIFNQYELAPYACGIQSVVLNYSEYPELYAKGIDCYHGDYVEPIAWDLYEENYRVHTSDGDSFYAFKLLDDDVKVCEITRIKDGKEEKETIKGEIPCVNEGTEADRPMEGYHCSQRVNTEAVPVDPADIKIEKQ